MIIFDTETTNLVAAIDSPLKNQPKIIELFALKVNDQTLEVESELDLLIDPKEQLSEDIQRITGLNDDMLRGKGDFATHASAITEFWFAERAMCGHNLTFDADMLEVELKRLGMVARFPWPPVRLCTVELSEHYHGRRLKLIDLHQHLFGEGFEQAHRARNDVMATYRCLKEMKARGDVPDF